MQRGKKSCTVHITAYMIHVLYLPRYITSQYVTVNLSHNTAKIYSYFHVNKVTKNANSTEIPNGLSCVLAKLAN